MFAGVYAYVEVGPLFDYEDLSDANTVTAEGVRQQLRILGAKIATRFSAKITHVVMWRGREEIVERARKRDPPPAIVSPNWLKMYGVCFCEWGNLARRLQMNKPVPENP